MTSKKVLIINEGYSDNLGDQAINNSLSLFFKENNYQVSFMYLSNPEITNKPNYKYLEGRNKNKKTHIDKIKTFFLFFRWYFKFKKIIIKNIKAENYDLIVIGGGQLIISSGSYSLSSFSISLFWITYLIKKYSNSKIYLVGIGTSKKFNFFEKKLYYLVLKRVSHIFVRDEFSHKNLKNFFNIKSIIIPDIAFYGEWNDKKFKNSKIFLLSLANYNEVFLRYNTKKISKKKYYENFYKIIQEKEKNNMMIKLFYTTKSDAIEMIEFKKYLKEKHNKTIQICKINTMSDLTNCFSKAHTVYSGRMHALILAYKQNCEVEIQTISQKLLSFNNFIKKTKINSTNYKLYFTSLKKIL